MSVLPRFYRDLNRLEPCSRVATIGNFDALHRGHQAVVQNVVTHAKRAAACSTLITFSPLPCHYFNRHHENKKITSWRTKLRLLGEWGIQEVLSLRFNESLSQLSPSCFVNSILVQTLNVRHLIVGEDFRFGQDRQGDIQSLKAMSKAQGFTVEALSLRKEQNQKISSSAIRSHFGDGDLNQVNHLLGRPFCIEGKVIKGAQRGRELGFPTANLHVNTKNMFLKGVYACRARLDGQNFFGVMNVGTRPTLFGSHVLAEVHLFNFDKQIYGQRLHVELLHKIRDEKRFENITQLSQQIAQDVQVAKSIFNKCEALDV